MWSVEFTNHQCRNNYYFQTRKEAERFRTTLSKQPGTNPIMYYDETKEIRHGKNNTSTTVSN